MASRDTPLLGREPMRDPVPHRRARRLVACVGIIAAIGLVVEPILGSSGQTFAAAARIKLVVFPIAFAVFLLAVIAPAPSNKKDIGDKSVPIWSIAPLFLSFAAFLVNFAFGNGLGSSESILQGSALMAGWAVFSIAGYRVGTWTNTIQLRLALILVACGTAAGIFQTVNLRPFVGILVPSTFAAIYFAFTVKRRSGYWLALGLVNAGLLWLSLTATQGRPTSGGVIGEVLACSFVILLALLPRTFRPLVLIVTVALAVVFFYRAGGVGLLLGTISSEDVTVAERSYEAHVVNHRAANDNVSLLFGRGPGAEVNLTFAPDARTLASSGRQLSAVDDVHLLTAYVTLKLGLAGILWLLAVFFVVARIIAREFSQKGGTDTGNMVLLMFLLSAIMYSLPAATNMFTNPLVPCLLGLLAANPSKFNQAGEEDQPRKIDTKSVRRF